MLLLLEEWKFKIIYLLYHILGLSSTAVQSGLFSKHLFHPETFRAQRVAWKNWQNFDYFSVFFNKIDILSYKVFNFVDKNAKIIKVLSVFQATRWTLNVLGWNEYLEKSPLCYLSMSCQEGSTKLLQLHQFMVVFLTGIPTHLELSEINWTLTNDSFKFQLSGFLFLASHCTFEAINLSL